MASEEPHLGSAASWLVEWTVGGAVLGPAPLLFLGVGSSLLYGPPSPGFLSRVAPVVLGAAFAGGLVAFGCALPARAFTAWLWSRVHPSAPWVLGPGVGAAIGAVVASAMVASRSVDVSWQTYQGMAAVGAGAGGGTLLVPWVVYVVLRSRRRSGWPALVLALAWSPVPLMVVTGAAALWWR